MNDIRIVHAFVEGEERELIETLEARITDLERERDNAWDKYAEVCQEPIDLEQAVTVISQEVELSKLRSLITDLERERDDYKADAGELREECRKLNEENDDLERELHEARESFADYAEEMGQRLAQAEKERDEAIDRYNHNCTWAERDLYARNRELMARLARAEKVVEAAKPFKTCDRWSIPQWPEMVAVNKRLMGELGTALAERGNDADS